ncbi:SRPBCC family protein [Streptomyces sp. NBC_01190]|uniref:SRPBCC family protein n=1 Tax=Streptomyces sp. NBC_01190 TaxID=2903767 RepID=UPI00386C4F4B|nr:hypothetical protein OG519_17725 [Streptomyces sp. NBC_01190]
MNTFDSHILIDAPVHVVRQLLLQPTGMSDWNPTFLSVSGSQQAVLGEQYAIQTRGGLTGHFEYRSIVGTRIEAHWAVPGFSETQRWELSPYNYGTHVRHTFEHHGSLTSLNRPAFAEVAPLRLNRLAARAESRVAVERVA